MEQNKIELSTPGICFSKVRGEILIHHSTIQALGNPYFICFLLNKDKGCLAIQKVDRKEKDSFTVPEFGEEEWKFRIYSERLLRILWDQFKWDEGTTYRCDGVLYPEHHLVEFDLKKARSVLDI